ncbi:hypothetical protein GCM10009109_17930 [Marinobacterium sediminicola]
MGLLLLQQLTIEPNGTESGDGMARVSNDATIDFSMTRGDKAP